MSSDPQPMLPDIEVDEARVQALWAGTQRAEARIGPRRVRRARAASMAAAVVLLAAGFGLRGALPGGDLEGGTASHAAANGELRLASGALPLGRTPEADETMTLADGTTLSLGAGSRWAPVRNEATLFESELSAGEIRFSIPPGGPRVWRLRAGPSVVEVLGTVFTVRHAPPDQLEVQVERGRVRVRDARLDTGARELSAGERLALPARTPAPDAERASTSRTDDAAARVVASPAAAAVLVETAAVPARAARAPTSGARREAASEPSRSAEDWRSLAEAGAYQEAYVALEASAGAAGIRELLLAADVARFSGHPRDAVAPLERILEAHGSDPRAAVAAVTLGRLEMDRLRRPARAQRAFERALTLGVPSALRGDVARRLARLAEERRAESY
ncbi:MAG: FecR family protein [Myxococcota bacterium]